MAEPLARDDRWPTAPVRLVHLGLGAFHRSHQAWYTAHASDAHAWGIASFGVRSPDLARALRAQGGLYTLITRGDAGDSCEVVPAIVEAWEGERVDRLADLVCRPEVAVVTLTVTEHGYGAREPGWEVAEAPLERLAVALDARRRADGGPIAVVPCDNLPGNGGVARAGLLRAAAGVDPALESWIDESVSFVSTAVDRITPPTTDADRAVAARAGWADAVPVAAEPFSEWVMCGEFPAGAPDWTSAGVRLTSDIAPFEGRKLWLLNGGHSLLAAAGLRRGLAYVHQAAAEPEIAHLVEAYWVEATRHLPGESRPGEYLAALRVRWANSRIAHPLSAIASGATQKVRVRAGAVARAERLAGHDARACAAAIGAWIASVDPSTGCAPGASDAEGGAVAAALASREPVRAAVALIDGDLAVDEEFVASVREAVAQSAGGRAAS